jgi:hypothetical protein
MLTMISSTPAQACNGIRLEVDMRCCLQTCGDRPGKQGMDGAIRRAPNSQTLFNLRQSFKQCQGGTDERNNFYACERADKKGPYNVGRRILGLPPG